MEGKCNCCGSKELIEGVVQTNEALKLVFIDNEDTKKLTILLGIYYSRIYKSSSFLSIWCLS